MDTERTLSREDAERRAKDLQHATRLRKTLKLAPGHTTTMTGRELRSWFGRAKLTDKARRDIDDAIRTASLTIDPPLVGVEELDAQHRLAHPLAATAVQGQPSAPQADSSSRDRATPANFVRPERARRARTMPIPPQRAGAPSSSTASEGNAVRPQFRRPDAAGAAPSPTPTRSASPTPVPSPVPAGAGSGRSKATWVGWGLAAVIGLGWIGSLGGDDPKSTPERTAQAPAAASGSSEVVPVAAANDGADDAAVERAGLVADAKSAASGGRYAEAYRIAVEAERGDLVKLYQTKGLSRARTRAEAAVRRGAPGEALSIVRTARTGYGSPGALAAVAEDARTAVAERQRERAAAKARAKAAARAAKQARADARAQAKAAASLAASQAESAASSSAGSDYAGMTCPEIGHSFTVEPGSDPKHDRDNDGIACESFQ